MPAFELVRLLRFTCRCRPPVLPAQSAIMLNKLKNMNPEAMSYYTINMNSFSDAPSLQVILEQVRFGAMYG